MRPNDAPSVAFHLCHIAGSIDRLLTYARGEKLSDEQFAALTSETDETSDLPELRSKAITAIGRVLDFLKNASTEILFEERFVGRINLPTNVFGLLFHIAEHTARHIGQMVTTAKIVRQKN